MNKINNINYTNWTNTKAKNIAKQVDKDGIQGLNNEEVIDFIKLAASQNMEKTEVYERLGVEVTNNKLRNSAANNSQYINPEFDNAINYYNNLTSNERSNITYQTYNNLEAKLHNMEKAIDNAFLECDAYKDIVIVPRWHYRYYPKFDDKLINFNLEEIRNTTTKDMNSLQELKENIEYIIEEANGERTHKEIEKTEYDTNALAEKYLGMNYEDFSSKYKNELEFCKTVTYADYNTMTETQRMVYSKAKAYAAEMLQITINEAHTVNWDAGERKVEETLKATDDMYTISEFESNGINEEGLEKLKSGIMYNTFQETLINKYHNNNQNGVDTILQENKIQKPKKQIINGNILIFHPDGSVYDISGKRVK